MPGPGQTRTPYSRQSLGIHEIHCTCTMIALQVSVLHQSQRIRSLILHSLHCTSGTSCIMFCALAVKREEQWCKHCIKFIRLFSHIPQQIFTDISATTCCQVSFHQQFIKTSPSIRSASWRLKSHAKWTDTVTADHSNWQIDQHWDREPGSPHWETACSVCQPWQP